MKEFMNTKDNSVPLIRCKKDYLTDEIARLQLALEQLQLKCPHENTKANALYWDGGYVDCIDCGKENIIIDKEKWIKCNSTEADNSIYSK